MDNATTIVPHDVAQTTNDTLIGVIMCLGDLVRKKGDIICQQKGITTQQWLVMLHLAHDPNLPFLPGSETAEHLSSSDLAVAMSVSRPNITSIVNTLIEKALVVQYDDHTDRRVRRIRLTEQGYKTIQEIQPIRQQANARLLGHIDENNKDEILEALIQCCRKLGL